MDKVNQSNNFLHTTTRVVYILTYVPVTTQWFIIKYEDMFPSLLKSFNIKKKQSCSYSITRATSLLNPTFKKPNNFLLKKF